MQIETKFKINDLVQHKFQRNTEKVGESMKSVSAYEVLEIKSATCSAGTQIFYECRSIHRVYTTDWVEGKKIKELIDIGHGYGIGEHNRPVSFREDELKECPPELVAEISDTKATT